MSTETEWFKESPPSVGWWPASRNRNCYAYRWWNGRRWSIPVYQHMCAAVAGMRANKPAYSKYIGRPVEWTHRPKNWPARSYT